MQTRPHFTPSFGSEYIITRIFLRTTLTIQTLQHLDLQDDEIKIFVLKNGTSKADDISIPFNGGTLRIKRLTHFPFFHIRRPSSNDGYCENGIRLHQPMTFLQTGKSLKSFLIMMNVY